jgi:hypothetical protein
LLQAREMIDEAQRSLSSSLEEGSFGDMSSGDVDEDNERIESVKAAAVSSVVGVLASLPISFYEVEDLPQLFLRSSIVFISCALFGVTFRYAVRRDLDNIQLKTGAPAAFAFVRGKTRQHGLLKLIFLRISFYLLELNYLQALLCWNLVEPSS